MKAVTSLSSKQRRGLLMKIIRSPETAEGCWLWSGYVEANGYGALRSGARPRFKVYAHRMAYELLRRPLVESEQIDHLCRVRACVNPWHMEPVSQKENILRGESPAALHAKKTCCPKGHPYSGENLVVTRRNARVCRECENMRARARRVRYGGRKRLT